MFRHHEPATRSPERSHERDRRAPEPPAELALALQRTAGNHATGRVLSRYTATNKDKYDKAARLPADVRELIAAVMNAHKATFESKDPRGPLVAPIEQWLTGFEATLKDWEATTDAATEAELMKTANEQMKAFSALRKTLFAKLGKDDEAAGEKAVKQVLQARKDQRAAAEKEKKEAVEAAAKKEADSKRRGELAAAFPIRDANGAYAPPADDKIEQFHEHVALSHPAFSGLTSAQLRLPTCPLYLLTAKQLRSVQDFVGSATLSGWKEQSTPTSRRGTLGFEAWIVPTKADLLAPELGGEIFADWVVENANHGFSVMRLMEIWSFVRGGSAFVKVTEKEDDEGKTGRKVYENRLKGVTETKVVSARNDAVLITCFDTGRRG